MVIMSHHRRLQRETGVETKPDRMGSRPMIPTSSCVRAKHRTKKFSSGSDNDKESNRFAFGCCSLVFLNLCFNRVVGIEMLASRGVMQRVQLYNNNRYVIII